MLYKTFSAAVYGIDAIKTNEDHFHTVGLPDDAVPQSRDWVRWALRNCGYDVPPTHITVNLAPAAIRKEGSGFDLPMALLHSGRLWWSEQGGTHQLRLRWRALARESVSRMVRLRPPA